MTRVSPARQPIRIGHKNWLLFGSDDHAQAAANLFSLVDAVQELAALRPAHACALRTEALSHEPARPATTPYLACRRHELAAAALDCCRPGP